MFLIGLFGYKDKDFWQIPTVLLLKSVSLHQNLCKMKTHLSILAGISLACLLLSGCQPEVHQEIDPMDRAIDSLVASIRPVQFPDLVIEVDEPIEADALMLLQEAIDRCSAQGGGTVQVNRGRYPLSGSLVLKSNVNLRLMKNASLRFSGRADDFLPVVPTRWEGTELLGRSSMIWANEAENIAITGEGTINAQAGVEMAAWGMQPGEADFEENVHGTHGETIETADVNQLRAWGEQQTDADGKEPDLLTFGQGTFLRPCCIEFRKCSRVLVEGVTIRDSPFWCMHPLYCEDVIVRGVTIDSHFPNNDGCDPESSRRVLIEDCLFRTGDDAVAIKSGRDADGRRVGKPSSGIVIRRCQFQSECNGLCIGSEMSGGVEDVYMDSVQIGRVKNALLFKSNKDRGGFIRRVWVRNIGIESAEGAVLRFENNYFGYRGGNYPARYEDFHIRQVHAGRAGSFAIYCDGLPELPMRHIEVDSLVVDSAARSYYLYNTVDCSFLRTWVNGSLLPDSLPQSPERQMCDVW